MTEGRSAFLDTLRGVAILGILPVNAAFFAYPSGLADAEAWPPGGHGAAAVHAVRFLFEGKFITIFALLFGAGMAILRERTVESGGRWGPLVARRLGFLWLAGVAHALLLWYGDIAAYYGIFGLLVCWAPGSAPEALKRWGAVLVALPMVPVLVALALALSGQTWVGDLVRSLGTPDLPDGAVGAGSGLLDPDHEMAVYRDGPFGAAVALRFATWAFGAAGAFPLWGPRIVGLFLLGMAFVREGWFLEPGSAEGRERFGRMLRWGIALGLPLTALDLLLHLLAPGAPLAALAGYGAHYVGSLGLAAAIVALVARATVRWPAGGAVRALSATGRMAFSNYLLQSVVMALLFQGSTVFLGAGFGLFGSVDRWTLLGIAAALAAVQVAGSVLWMRAFRMGPVEWAWRAVTHLRRPAMRRGGCVSPGPG